MKSLIMQLRNFVIVTIAMVGVLNMGVLAPSASAAPCEPTGSVLGFPTWYKYLDGEDNQGKCRPLVDTSEDALPIGLAIFEIALALAGIVAVAMIFIGSFSYITTLGEPEKAARARKTAVNALIGLAIVLIAARVVSFLAGRITGAG